MKFFLLLLLLAPLEKSFAAENCAPINHCLVEKVSWGKKGWTTLYSKELKIDHFCEFERPNLQVEEELGIELWNFKGDSKAKDYKAKPWVSVNLYTYKLTNVVASANAPLTQEFIHFSHRLKPKGKELVNVTCSKK